MRSAAFTAPKVVLLLVLALFAVDSFAAITNAGLLDNVLLRYQTAASGWAAIITKHATWLYWILVLISMVWTFAFMAMRRADIGEFFVELIRFTIFVGFFWWILFNGPRFATSIMDSLRQIGGEAAGLGPGLSPSGIVDIGFEIFYKVLDQSSVWEPVDSVAGIVMALVILVVLALIGVNMLMLLISGWVLAYGGIFFLGFGGSRWTSDMAINYYKTVLAVGAQLFAMVLLIGIGKTFLDDYYLLMSKGISLKEIGVMLVAAVILLVLTNKIPQLVAGIITGASVGSVGGGSFGAGAALGAGAMAVAGAATGGALLAAGASQMAGGAQALMAAFSKASDNMASGSGMFAGAGGGSGASGAHGSGGGEAGGGSPLAAAMGGSGGGGSSEGGTSAGAASDSGGSQQQGKSEGGASGGGGGGGGGDPASGGGGAASASNGGAAATLAAAEGASDGAGKPAGGVGQGSSESQAPGTPADGSTPDQPPGTSSPAGGNVGAASVVRSTLGAAGRAAATAGLFAADVGMNLAKGTAEVAKEKVSAAKDRAKERIGQTVGGQIANAISRGAVRADESSGAERSGGNDEQPAFGDDSLGAGTTREGGQKPAATNDNDEVAAFVNKKSSST